MSDGQSGTAPTPATAPPPPPPVFFGQRIGSDPFESERLPYSWVEEGDKLVALRASVCRTARNWIETERLTSSENRLAYLARGGGGGGGGGGGAGGWGAGGGGGGGGGMPAAGRLSPIGVFSIVHHSKSEAVHSAELQEMPPPHIMRRRSMSGQDDNSERSMLQMAFKVSSY